MGSGWVEWVVDGWVGGGWRGVVDGGGGGGKSRH